MVTSMLSKSIRVLLNHYQKRLLNISRMSSKTAFYETLSVTVPHEFVYHVSLNRPQKLNAFNKTLWFEIQKCFNDLDDDEDCRVIVLSAAGRIFAAGIDFMDIMELAPKLAAETDVARKAKIISKSIMEYQKSMTSLESCKKPVLAAIHSACIGAGVDMITAADMRYCTKDAYFQIKEVDIGMAADVGVLQRLPKVIGSDSLARELCYTARKVEADEALSCGLVSRVFENKEKMLEEVLKIAETIAQKSPTAIQVTKMNLVYSRDHPVENSLQHIALWNQMMLQGEDFVAATMGQINKDKNVKFSKL